MFDVTNERLYDLSGKVALVTGGSRGIGLAIAARLAAAGAQVMITSVTPGSAAQAAAQLREAGWQAEGLVSDASQALNARADVQSTVERWGRLDILVNNAGIFPPSLLQQTTEELWDRVLDTNLKGAFFATQAAAQQMIAQGQGGRIINIGSVGSLRPNFAFAHYDASKAGMLMLTKSTALELGAHQITVNLVAPGVVLTDGVQRASAGSGYENVLDNPAMQRQIERIPLRRIATPDDVARPVLFLASSAADYITGAVLSVDGGVLLT